MALDVKGPNTHAGAAELPSSQPKVAQHKAGISGAQALKNAEGAFDKAFSGAGALPGTAAATAVTLQPVAIAPDAMATPAVKQAIIDVFTALKGEFLQGKPSGPVAESMAHEVVLQFSAAAEQTPLQLAQQTDQALALASASPNLPLAAKQAVELLKDLKHAGQLEGLMNELQIVDGSPLKAAFAQPSAKAQLQKMEMVIAKAAEWVLSPMAGGYKGGATGGAKGGKSAIVKEDKSTRGSSNPGGWMATPGHKAPSSAGGQAAGAAPSLVEDFAGKVAPFASDFMKRFANASIEELIMLMFMDIAKDAEQDLRSQLTHMRQQMQLKDLNRKMVTQMKQAQADLKKEAQRQLDDLKAQGLVNDSVTVDDYLAYANVQFTAPTINPETGDSSYVPPSLSPPVPMPEAWAPAPPRRHETLDAAIGAGLSGLPLQLDEAGCFKADGTLDAEKVKAYWRQTHGKEIDATVLSNMLKAVKKDPAAMAAATQLQLTNEADYQRRLAEHEGRYGSPVMQEGCMNFAQFEVEIQKQQDAMDSISAQSELDQIKMQSYLDRRKQAFETVSNTLKKFSDTSATLIKNLT